MFIKLVKVWVSKELNIVSCKMTVRLSLLLLLLLSKVSQVWLMECMLDSLTASFTNDLVFRQMIRSSDKWSGLQTNDPVFSIPNDNWSPEERKMRWNNDHNDVTLWWSCFPSFQVYFLFLFLLWFFCNVLWPATGPVNRPNTVLIRPALCIVWNVFKRLHKPPSYFCGRFLSDLF